MSRFSLYSHLPVRVQDWIVALYSYKLERQRYGKEFERLLETFLANDTWSAEQILAYKEEHIARIIDIAYHHCPFYRQKYDTAGVTPSTFTCFADLQKFPVLTKEEVRENLEGMLSDYTDRKTLIHYHTSGSTGKALDFYNTPQSLQAYWAVCARYKLRFGIRRKDPHLNFTGKLVVPLDQYKPPYWRYRKAQNQYMLNMQHITAEKITDIMAFIARMRFKQFVGYPSIMHTLADLAMEQGLIVDDSPDFICSSAEKMYNYQRNTIAKVFPHSVFVQHYGFSENAGSASMCQQLHYHEDFEIGHLELHKPEQTKRGLTGELLATGFFNTGMPFIRYGMGDTATFSDEICACGRHSQVIAGIEGRNEDYILMPEGTRIMRFDYLFKDTHTIKECQVVQREHGAMVVRIVRRDGYTTAVEKDLTERVHTMFSPTIRVHFEYVNEIPRTKAGKFKAVVSEMKHA